MKAIDFFCGAGGSSTGMKAAGAEVVMAVNHWQLAIDTHNTNHPTTDHDCVDIRTVHPSIYPHTEIFWASPECFPTGTLILTDRGLISIEDVKVEDRVLTHRNRWMPVTRVMQTVKDSVIVSGQGHSALETTSEHPFYVRTQTQRWNNEKRDYDRRILSEPDWVAAAALETQTYRWASPVQVSPLPVPPVEGRGMSLDDPEFWWLVGRWLGDGTIRIRPTNSEITIACGKHKADALEQRLAHWLPDESKDKAEFGELRWRRRGIRTAELFECAHQGFAQWLVTHFGKLAHGKTIPAWAFSLPVEHRQALLNGYLSADGHISARRTRADSVSKRLALGIKLLAGTLGFHPTFASYHRKPGKIEGRDVPAYDSYAVAWENNASQRTGVSDDLHAWTLVKSVKPGRNNITVYNLSVSEDESYIADGIVVHNCTNHSLAKGKKRKSLNQLDLWGETAIDPSEEKSRATMREVIEFAEYHHNKIVIVENVVDIRYWQFYDDWIQAMINLGYEYRTLYLNAQFFGVPQSRDRWYTVFWLKGNKAPDLDFRPATYCPTCEQWIEAVQSWKKSDWGRYGKNRQYVYRCPICAKDVEPGTIPAAAVIDWSIPAPRIGDRERPLREKTMERIRAGLKKFGGKPFDLDMAWAATPYPVDAPLPTQTTRQTLALLQPFLMSYYGRNDASSRVDAPIPVIPTEPRHSLIVPPFMLSYYNQENPARSVDDPMYTVAGRNTPALCIPPFIVPFRGTINGIQPPKLVDSEPLDAIVSSAIHHGLVIPLRGTAAPKTSDDPLTTVIASAQQHALIAPPFTVSVTHSAERLKPVDQPFNTVMPQGNPGLVTPPFVMSYYGSAPTYAGVDAPLPTMTTVQRHALIDPETLIEDCGFRMLEPEELKRGMSFPGEYVILGNKRDQVRQIGNAVCCNVAYWITRQCIASLEGSAA